MNAGAAVLVLAAMACGSAPAVYGAEVLTTEVSHARGRYGVHFDVRLAAPPDRLKRHLTDYANYAGYFESIKESTVLARKPDGVRVRLRMRSCVLFFCKTVTTVKDITEQDDGKITARIDPALSDFHEATEHWRITADNGATRLQYDAVLVPSFFVPPLIGPWLVRNQIRVALLSGARKLEALANE